MVFATDLDRTMIFSKKFINEENAKYSTGFQDGQTQSFMTNKSLQLLESLKRKIIIVPCTTRSREQFKRVIPFENCKYAICSNGGTILINGFKDSQWNFIMRKNMDFCEKELLDIKSDLEKQSFLSRGVDFVDKFFLFTRTNNIEKCMEFLKTRVDTEKFYFTFSTTKVYIFPTFISKKHALSYVLDKIGDNDVIVAGDSEVDFEMMKLSTIKSFIPVHDKTDINLISTEAVFLNKCGILAGEMILEQVNDILEKEEKVND